MKILYITQLLPFPPDSGGKIKTYQTIKALSKKNKIFLISLVDSPEKIKYEENLKPYLYCLKTFILPSTTQRIRFFYLKILLNLFNPTPFSIKRNYSREVEKYITEVTLSENFDAIHVDHLLMTQYLPKKFSGLKVYEEHNLYTVMFKRYFTLENSLKKKFFYLTEYLKFLFYEPAEISKFDKVLCISRNDQQNIKKYYHKKTFFLPVPFRVKKIYKPPIKPVILFTGVFSWWPNADGFWWFYINIFPIIIKTFPETKLLIVGQNPSKEILEIENKNVIVTGKVKSLLPYYKKASVFISPVRAGGGIRIKILETMSFGIPFVSTTVGIEGINIKNGYHGLVADDPVDFATKTIELLRNTNLALNLSNHAADFIRSNYNDNIGISILNRAYGEF